MGELHENFRDGLGVFQGLTDFRVSFKLTSCGFRRRFKEFQSSTRAFREASRILWGLQRLLSELQGNLKGVLGVFHGFTG